jgi:hypothetical protein
LSKPILYDNDGGNSLYFNGAGLTDTGTGNLLPINVAAITSIDGVWLSGTQFTSLGFVESPARLNSGTHADLAIDLGCVGIEYTGTGTSEQITTSRVKVVDGETYNAGAWVYLESIDSLQRVVTISWYSFDSSNTTLMSSGIEEFTVPDREWTWISDSATLSAPTADEAGVYVAMNGNQSIGDKLYVGAWTFGSNLDWEFPTTPDYRGTLDIRFEAKILGDGPIISARPLPGGTARSFNIEALNGGFHVSNTTSLAAGAYDETNYTTAADIFWYDNWSSFRWTFNWLTGVHNFYVIREGKSELIDTGAVVGIVAKPLTSYGLDTKATGLNVDAPRCLIRNVEMYESDEGVGFTVFSSDKTLNITEDALGQEVDFGYDTTALSVNQSLHLSESGWLTFADATEFNALKVNYDASFKFGVGDFTVVQSGRGVGSTNSRPFFYDGGIFVGAPVADGATVFEVNGVGGVCSTNVFDGERFNYLFERESGVSQNFYLNDFEVPDTSTADAGADLNDVGDVQLGYFSGVDSGTFMSGSIGVTIMIDRLLEGFERDELQDWLDVEYPSYSEPAWLRDAAVLYLNPTDPVQLAEWHSNGVLINLAVTLPSELYVRHTLTSVDGVSNPVLDKTEFSVGNIKSYENDDGIIVTDSHPVPVYRGVLPNLAWGFSGTVGQVEAPSRLAKPGWFNKPWTVSLWFKYDGVQQDAGISKLIFGQNSANGTDDEWNIFYQTENLSVGRITFHVNGVEVAHVDAAFDDKFYSATLTHDGSGNVAMFIDGTSMSTGTFTPPLAITGDFEIGNSKYDLSSFEGLIGPVHMWYRKLTNSEISSVYELGSKSQSPSFGESITITSAVTSSQFNWEKI